MNLHKRKEMDLTGYSSNVLGALTVAGIAGVAWCVRNKLKHSECDFNTGCLKIRSHEDSETRNTIRREVLAELRKDGLLIERGELTPERDIEEGAVPCVPSNPIPVPSPFKLLGESPILLTVPSIELERPRKRARNRI